MTGQLNRTASSPPPNSSPINQSNNQNQSQNNANVRNYEEILNDLGLAIQQFNVCHSEINYYYNELLTLGNSNGQFGVFAAKNINYPHFKTLKATKTNFYTQSHKYLTNMKNIKKCVTLKPHNDFVYTIDFLSQDSKLFLITGSIDSTISIYDMTTNKTILRYTGHSGAVNCIKSNYKENLILSVSGDGSCHIWQFADLTLSDLISNENSLQMSPNKLNNEDPNILHPHLSTKQQQQQQCTNSQESTIHSLRTPLWSSKANHSMPLTCCEFLGNLSQSISSNTNNVKDVDTINPMNMNKSFSTHHIITGNIVGTIRLYDFYESKSLEDGPIPIWKNKQSQSPIRLNKIFTYSLKMTNKYNTNEFFALYRSKICGWDIRQKENTFELSQLTQKGIYDAEFRTENELLVCHGDKAIRIHDTRNLMNVITVKKFDKLPRMINFLDSPHKTNNSTLDHLNSCLSVLHMDKITLLDYKYKRKSTIDNNEKFIITMNTIRFMNRNILAISSVDQSIKIFELPDL